MLCRQIVTAAIVCGAASAAACSGESPTAPGSLTGSSSGISSPFSATSASLASSGQAASVATAPLQVFPTGAPLPGTASLVRNDAGISMTLHAEGLTPGYAYTVWFVAFNDPAACDGPCDVTDVLANRGVPAVRFAAGHVIGGSGDANFGGRLAVGQTGGAPCAAGPGLGSCGPGLLNARTALVHLVVRSHGPAIPELVNEQINSFNGACPPNACANLQFAAFEPEP
jgi:hypothetical protein